MIRFVIPAYNEAENIPKLLADLAPVARELGARVIIVDDGSTDGTAEVGITLACTVCKRRNYQTEKSKRNTPDRVEFKKYCRWCGSHTPHRETR